MEKNFQAFVLETPNADVTFIEKSQQEDWKRAWKQLFEEQAVEIEISALGVFASKVSVKVNDPDVAVVWRRYFKQLDTLYKETHNSNLITNGTILVSCAIPPLDGHFAVKIGNLRPGGVFAIPQNTDSLISIDFWAQVDESEEVGRFMERLRRNKEVEQILAPIESHPPLFATVMTAAELFSAIDFAKEKCKDEEHKLLIGEETTYLFRGPLKPNGEEIDTTWAVIADIEPCGEGTALATLAFDLEGGMTSKFVTTKILVHYLQAKSRIDCEGSAVFMWARESDELVADFLRRKASG